MFFVVVTESDIFTPHLETVVKTEVSRNFKNTLYQ